MIIDDEPARRKRIYDVLKLTGEDIFSSSTGDAAMELMPHEQPDIVLVNISSDRVGGVEFIKTLRTYGMGQKMKVLGVYGGKEDEKKSAALAGADDVMDEDIPPYELLEVVAKQLGVDQIEIPKEQLSKRREVVEEVVADYRSRAEESKTRKGRPLSVKLFLPGRQEPLLMLTEDAGKEKILL
jgi:two-component system response regulator (stage 0 sporulation protein F)